VLTAVHNKLHHPQYTSCIKATVFVPLSVKLHIKSYNDGFALHAANGYHHSTATPPPHCFIQHTRLSLSGGEPSSVAVNKEKRSGPSEKTVGLPRAIFGTMIEEATEGQDIWITKTKLLYFVLHTKLAYGYRIVDSDQIKRQLSRVSALSVATILQAPAKTLDTGHRK